MFKSKLPIQRPTARTFNNIFDVFVMTKKTNSVFVYFTIAINTNFSTIASEAVKISFFFFEADTASHIDKTFRKSFKSKRRGRRVASLTYVFVVMGPSDFFIFNFFLNKSFRCL